MRDPGRIESPAADPTPGPGEYVNRKGEMGTGGPKIGMQGKAKEAAPNGVPGPRCIHPHHMTFFVCVVKCCCCLFCR